MVYCQRGPNYVQPSTLMHSYFRSELWLHPVIAYVKLFYYNRLQFIGKIKNCLECLSFEQWLDESNVARIGHSIRLQKEKCVLPVCIS